MVFTQGPLSLGESLGRERRNASVAFFSDGDSGTPSISVQAANLWYNLHDTCIVRFVVDGCRKNLPLCDISKWIIHTAHLPNLVIARRQCPNRNSGKGLRFF